MLQETKECIPNQILKEWYVRLEKTGFFGVVYYCLPVVFGGVVFFLELGKNINFPQGVKGESDRVSLFRAFYDLSSSKQAIQRFTGSKVRQPYFIFQMMK